MFSKFSMFEHNESEYNETQGLFVKSEARKEKGWAQQVKNKKCKNIFLFLLFSL